MQPITCQNVINLRIGLPVRLSIPNAFIAKICKECVIMAGVVLFAVLSTLLMGL